MHDSERLRVIFRQVMQHETRVVRVGHIVREWAPASVCTNASLQRSMMLLEVVGLSWSHWWKRSEQNSVFSDSSNRTPASQPCGTCGVGNEPEPVSPGQEHVVAGQHARRPQRKIIHAHYCSHQAANRFRRGCNLEPLVQAATVIRFKMAEPDMPDSQGSINREISCRRRGNIPRNPAWNSSGSSSLTRKWLNSRLISGTNTEIR